MTDEFVWKDKFHWSKAFSRSDVPSVARAVAYVIYNHAGGDGKKSHPGMEALMVDTGLSESAVGRHLKIITGSGWVHQVSSGSNSGRAARASVYDLTYPPGYSDSAAKELRDEKLKEMRERREVKKGRREHPSPVTDDPEEHPSQMTGDNPPESGTPVTHDGEHPSPVTGTPVTSDCLPDPLPDPISDPPPLAREEEDDDISSLYEEEINMVDEDLEGARCSRLVGLVDRANDLWNGSDATDDESQELIEAGFTYHKLEYGKSLREQPPQGWSYPSWEEERRIKGISDGYRARQKEVKESGKRRQWEEMQRVEAEARAERDREFEAERAQRQAQAEIDKLAELKSIEWVSRNWDRFEQFCTEENVGIDRQLTLAKRAKVKATSSPFGLFKTLVSNGVDPGSPAIDWSSIGAAPPFGRAWEE